MAIEEEGVNVKFKYLPWATSCTDILFTNMENNEKGADEGRRTIKYLSHTLK